MDIVPVTIPINGPAGSNIGYFFQPGRKFELVGLRFGARTAITGNSTNYAVLSVIGSDESTVIWQWDTDTGDDSTVAAGTVYGPHSLDYGIPNGDTEKAWESGESRTLRTYDANQALEVINDQSNGSGVAFVDAGLTLLIRYC